MKFLLFSDSHGKMDRMVKAVRKNGKVDGIIHLGDCVQDILGLMRDFPGYRYEFVKGNNDWSREYPDEKMIELEGKRIFLTHGHHYNVKYDYQRIILRGKAARADAVFFGHTHQPEEMFSDGMLVLNPGSIGLPSWGENPTYCSVEIAEGKIRARFFGIG